MTISTYKVGPGVLTFKATGAASPFDASCQVLSCQVSPSENEENEDDITVLCGEELAGEGSVSHEFELAAKFLQDTLNRSGLVAYTWANKGVVVDFDFTPNNTLDAVTRVTGKVRIIPLSVGGDVKARAETEATFKIIGTPDLVFPN